MRTSGFSLVEVLIAVVVLALGILGLAAIFPAVIAQQRNAQSETLGSVAASTAKANLQRETSRLPWQLMERDGGLSFDGTSTCDAPRHNGLWSVFDWGQGEAYALDRNVFETYRDTGAVLFGGGRECVGSAGGLNPPIYEPIEFYPTKDDRDPLFAHERLLPEPFSGPDPQFVWDFVPRKVGSGGQVQLQLAVFVRRIDPNIRVPDGQRLAQVLYTGAWDRAPAAFPVAVEPSGPRAGLPSNNGKGQYAVPRSLNVTVADVANGQTTTKVISLTDGTVNERRLAAQVGQKLVDNLGVIRTVTKAVTDSRGTVTGVEVLPELDQGEADRILQVVFTPQIPVEVVIVNP